MAPKTRTERHDEDHERKSMEIQEAAISLFARKGYAGTSIEDIANELGYSKATLYYYFHNKEEIFLDIMINTLDRLAGAMDSMTVPECSAPEDMARIIDHFIDEKFEKIGLFQVFHQIQTFFSEVKTKESRDKIKNRLGLIMDKVEAITTRGCATGQLRQDDPRMLATLFMGMIFGVCFFNDGISSAPDTKGAFKTLVRSIILDGFTSGTQPRKEQ